MPLSDLLKFTLRLTPIELKKFRFVAEYNGRSANREAEILFRRHVEEFEKQHGPISSADLQAFDPKNRPQSGEEKGKI